MDDPQTDPQSDPRETIRQLEARLEEARKEADEQNRAKDNFLANVSHELRTPLNGIIGFGEIISESRDMDSVHRYADLIVSESMKLRRLINQLLDISRFTSGQIVLEENPFNVQSFMEQLDTALSSQAFEKGLAYQSILEEEVPPILKGDYFRLTQMITNLLDNAVKFTEHGRITFRISLEKAGTPPQICFEVSDTGAGIPEDQQQNIFDRFSQAENGRNRSFGGSGLGLSITKELAEKMGGTISLESVPGEGTAVRLHLPLPAVEDAAAVHQDQPETLPFDLSGLFPDMRILIAEDYQPNREVLEAHLGPTNADLVAAANGQEALKAVQDEAFDLVLMDVQMPVMDGWEATRKIRELYSPRELPILGITADAFPQDRLKCLEAGMNGVIVKPLRRRKLMETILNIISGSRPEEPAGGAPDPGGAETPAPGKICRVEEFLNEIGDPDLGQKILRGFLDKLPRQEETITEALRARNWETAHREAHSIKGGARNIMADRLAAAARRTEGFLKDPENPAWEEADESLPPLLQAIRELQDHMKGRATPSSGS